jgi:sulfate permease, SulP family
VTVNMEGDIYFAAAEDLDVELLRCITPDTKVVVLRMRGLRAVGSTAMSMLEYFWTLLRRRNIRLVVSGIQKELEDVMTKTGVRAKIGEANIFFADNNLFQATELAMARAKSIADWERQGEATARIDVRPDRRGTAKEIMNTRCIRFGNKHQLREAMWLMSELHKTTKSISPEPLFLQDREGKLFGELSPWRILETLFAGVDRDAAAEMSDEELKECLRRDFTKPIRLVARTDLARQDSDASVARLLETAVVHDQYVVPICDDDDRVKGLVDMEALARGLRDALLASNGREDATTEDGGG